MKGPQGKSVDPMWYILPIGTDSDQVSGCWVVGGGCEEAKAAGRLS
jgi:hypothetical protein